MTQITDKIIFPRYKDSITQSERARLSRQFRNTNPKHSSAAKTDQEVQMTLPSKSTLRRVTLLFVVFAPLLQAQQSRWQNLAEIRSGTKIQVIENSLKSTSGTFVNFSETELTIQTGADQVAIPRERVYRVSLTGKNRKRNTLIGLAIGAGIGAGTGAAANRVVGNAAIIPALMGVDGAVGAGIGALVPAAKTVYRSEIPKQTAHAKTPQSIP